MSFEHLLPAVSTLAKEIISGLAQERGAVDPLQMSDALLIPIERHSQNKEDQTGVLSQAQIAFYAESTCNASLELDSPEFIAFVRDLVARGLDIEILYLDIIPPAIRLLHDKWELDQISFLEVTTSTWSFKRLIFDLSPEFIKPGVVRLPYGADRPQVLVATAGRAQHTMGPLIVSQYLQRKGWSVLPSLDYSEQSVLDVVAASKVDLLCLSISLTSEVPAIKSWLALVKKQSKNPGIKCFLGGPLISTQPDLVCALGADLVSNDVRAVHTLGTKLVASERRLRVSRQKIAKQSKNKSYFDLSQSLVSDLGVKPSVEKKSQSPSAVRG